MGHVQWNGHLLPKPSGATDIHCDLAAVAWKEGRRASGLEWEQGTKCKNGLRHLTHQTSFCLEWSLDHRISHPTDLSSGERFGTVKSWLMCWKGNCLNLLDRRPLREFSWSYECFNVHQEKTSSSAWDSQPRVSLQMLFTKSPSFPRVLCV